MNRRLLLVLLALVSLVAACGDDGGETGEGTPSIMVARAFVPTPAGANGALYFEVANEGDGADRLIGASTSVAGESTLHETMSSDDGLMRMEPLDGVEVPAGETVTFEPGGLHVMLLDVEELAEGDTVEVVLTFEESGDIVVEAEVGPYDDGQR
jgi:periplasmic copper chaperone A